MSQLTPQGQKIIADLAQRHGFSVDAVIVMLRALDAGGGGMAQFDHPEFGGMGQWSRGGMVMVSDMFNNALKARVDSLCTELAGLVSGQSQVSFAAGGQSQGQRQGGSNAGFSDSLGGGHAASLFVAGAGRSSGGWWPDGLGQPSSTGQQNNIRYAVFPAARRLVIDIAGRVSVYDTLDHHIGGVSQQQSSDASLTFTSQRGLVRLADLPIIAAEAPASDPPVQSSESKPLRTGAAAAPAVTAAPPEGLSRPPIADPSIGDDIFAKLERLAGLREKGILSEEEFTAKKSELLARL